MAKKRGKKKPQRGHRNPKTGLPINHQRLVDKYEGERTLKAAAEYAGISYGWARILITKPNIKAAIQEKQEKLKKKVEINQEWVLERYKKLVDYKITDFFNDKGEMKPLSEIPEEAVYAICGLEVSKKTEGEIIETLIHKFKLSDKKSSLDSIVNVLGLAAPKKLEHTGKDGGPIETRQIKELTDEELLKIASRDHTGDGGEGNSETKKGGQKSH